MSKDGDDKRDERDDEDNRDATEAEEEAPEEEAADDDDADDADDDGADDDEDEPLPDPPKKVKAKAATARARRPQRRVRRKRGSPTRNVVMFVFLVGGLAAAFAVFGNRRSGGGPVAQAKWKTGQTVNVEITLVTTDYKNLACAMKDEVKGKSCAYEAQNKRKGGVEADARKNANLLQPYTTLDRIQLFAANMWAQPELKAKLDKENWDRPSPRFSVKCKYTVEGRSRNAFVQWKPGEGWHDGKGWYVGTLKACKIQK